MDQDLVEEIEYLNDLLAKSGFFNKDEILEILEDQFIEEDLDFSQFKISSFDFKNDNFNKLESVFESLTSRNILTIHNCGFDIEEGVEDTFELFIHLKNNNFNPIGFCFYTFEDVEEAISENKLYITFGDFENIEDKALEIGNIVYNSLKENFDVNWDGTVNQIEIVNFIWDKSYNENKEYEIEGAYELFVNNSVLK